MGLYKGWEEDSGPASQRSIYHDELRVAGSDGHYLKVAPDLDF
jgi:hypothetical protein